MTPNSTRSQLGRRCREGVAGVIGVAIGVVGVIGVTFRSVLAVGSARPLERNRASFGGGVGGRSGDMIGGRDVVGGRSRYTGEGGGAVALGLTVILGMNRLG